MARVICQSGLRGWQNPLRDNYVDLEEFRAYAEIYHLHIRLGYATVEAAWEDNPLVEGSTNPADFRKSEPQPQ